MLIKLAFWSLISDKEVHVLGRENSLLRILQSWAPSSTNLLGKTTQRDDEIYKIHLCTEPVFVNLLRAQDWFPAWRPGTTILFVVPACPAMLHWLAESNPRNRFLVSINVYKYRLRPQVVFFYRGLRHLWKSCRIKKSFKVLPQVWRFEFFYW